MYINAIYDADLQNGKGVGVTICLSGCRMHCPGCFNPEAQNMFFGRQYIKEIEEQILNLLDRPYIDHVAVIGGEPLLRENMPELSTLCLKIKSHWPQKKIWLWSGYLWEEIYDLAYGNTIQIGAKTGGKQTGWTLEDKANLQILLENIDVLVDGPFIQEKKDLTLKWRGSSNQRVISVQTTLAHGLGQNPILYCI